METGFWRMRLIAQGLGPNDPLAEYVRSEFPYDPGAARLFRRAVLEPVREAVPYPRARTGPGAGRPRGPLASPGRSV